mgnify:CR=1 FL=1
MQLIHMIPRDREAEFARAMRSLALLLLGPMPHRDEDALQLLVARRFGFHVLDPHSRDTGLVAEVEVSWRDRSPVWDLQAASDTGVTSGSVTMTMRV